MAVFGSGTPVSKLVVDAFPPFLASGLRVLLGCLILLPWLIAEWDEVKALRGRDWWPLVGIAAIGMFAFSALMLLGMRLISGVAGSVIMSTTPAVTAAGAMLFFGERMTWRRGGAIACAVVGVLALHVLSPEEATLGSGLWLGSLLIFGAVCSEAAYTLLGKQASDRLSPVAVAALGAGLSLPLFAPFAVPEALGFDWGSVAAADWWALGWWGAGTLALGSALWYLGVKAVPGSIAAAFMGIMPVSALVLSYALLGESFHGSHAVGFAIVFAGVVLISIEHARMSDA